MLFFEFLSSFSLPGMARTHPAPPFAGRKHRTLPLFSTFGLLLRPIENSGLTFFVLFARSDESIRRFPLIENIRNTFYKHTKIAFIRRISNFGPNKITRFRKFFHRTPFSALFSRFDNIKKNPPGKVSGNFKAVRTNFIHHALFTTASTIGKKYTTGNRSTRTRRNSPHRKCGATPRER